MLAQPVMSSIYAIPMQLLGVGCELLFVLENKLRGGTKNSPTVAPSRKSDMVLEDVARAIFGNLLLKDMFTGRKPLRLEELREVMLGAVTNPSLKIETGSFDWLFAVACMGMKSNLLRVDSAWGMMHLIEEKLTVILEMFSNPQMKFEIERARSAMKVFYGSMSMGGLCRLRSSQLSVFRTLIVPVVTLINEGYQLETGHLVPCKTGPNTGELGSLRTFNRAGSVRAVSRIPFADVTAGIATNQQDAVPNVFDSSPALRRGGKPVLRAQHS